jgi:hypothetical protein
MSLVIKDRVRVTSTTAGNGTFTLGSAVTGFQDFSAIGNGNTTYYTIALQNSSEWEVGIGTYTSSGTTLSRDTVLSSSSGGSKVVFSSGTKDVFVSPPSETYGAIPVNAQTASYTLAEGDNGQVVSITTGGVTAPSSISPGRVISVFNNSGSNQTITQGSGLTLRLAGTATTGNRTLAQYGLCTVVYVASGVAVISGVGLT